MGSSGQQGARGGDECVLNGGPMAEGCNNTVISLIPKVQKHKQVTDLCPISLPMEEV